MKPWEETWQAEIWMHDDLQRPLWGVTTNHEPPKAGSVELPICEFEPNEGPRAQLAAAAPDMARLLLELREQTSSGGRGHCIFCSWTEPDLNGVEDAAEQQRLEDAGHEPGCRLMAALRKAGVTSQASTATG